MLSQLKRAVTGRTASRVFRECRHCGTGVREAVEGCPTCGSTEIARYEF